jgi:hypothetical protein
MQPTTPNSGVRITLENVVLTTVILRKLATTLSIEPNLNFAEPTASICKRVLDDTPTADLYLLQLVQPRDSLCALVKSDTLNQLGLAKWKINGGILLRYKVFPLAVISLTDVLKFSLLSNFTFFRS